MRNRVTGRISNHWTAVVFAISLGVLGLAWSRGSVLGLYSGLVLSVYVSGVMLPTRVRVVATVISTFLAALPWMGLGTGEFIYPGAEDPLPRLPLHECGAAGELLKLAFGLPYLVSELPLNVAVFCSNDIFDVVVFPGEGVVRIRPFAVFVFWGGTSLALVIASVQNSRDQQN